MVDLLLQKKQELFSFPCTFFQFIVYGKMHETKLLRLLHLLDSQLEIKIKKPCLRDKKGLKST